MMLRFILLLLGGMLLAHAAVADALPLLLSGAGDPAPLVYYDFTQMTAANIAADTKLSNTRAGATSHWSCSNPPVLIIVPSGQVDIGGCDPVSGQPLGLNIWAANTIQNKWSRDLTHSDTWQATGITAAHDQLGANGEVNGASSLTATAPNGTIIYITPTNPIPHSLYMAAHCIVCTGKVYFTGDGGNIWNDITGYLGPNYNGTVPPQGFREISAGQPGIMLQNSGDKIAVDYINLLFDPNDNIPAPGPLIETDGTQNVVRPVDFVTLDLTKVPGWGSGDGWVIFSQVYKPYLPGNALLTTSMFFQVDDGLLTNAPANVIYMRNQTDVIPGNTGCTPSTNPGVTPYCPDYNVSTLFNGTTPAGIGKTRCAYSINQLQGLVNPLPRSVNSNIIAYLNPALKSDGNNLADFCNNGAGSGNQSYNRWAAASAFGSGIFNRVIFGSSQSSIGSLVGPLNGSILRFGIWPASAAPKIVSMLARLSALSPTRNPGILRLQDGSRLLYETGKPIPCNAC